jgi:threonine dehydrogenase-like Zn-dependent dehydrogenase
MKGMKAKDIVGHECEFFNINFFFSFIQLNLLLKGMGIVESVGSNVKNIKVGDRVVVSAPIACGQCECKSSVIRT